MKLARRAISDPDRRLELEEAFDARLAELLAEANDAGYGSEEAVEALLSAAKHQAYANGRDPDPADDPS